MSLTSHLANGKQVLAALPVICQLSPRVWRFLGCNPGAYTLQSTNTYLVGTGPERILIDTGEGKKEYVSTLREGMEQAGCKSISRIIVSHWHHDHLGGVPSIVDMFAGGPIPSVHKYMPESDEELFGGEGSVDPYSLYPRENFVPLSDGEIVQTEGASLRVLHTPGHANDHVALVLEEECAMFTADNVLGTGTAVFNDLRSYLASLQKMASESPGRLYPGHGDVVEDGQQKIEDYIEHRAVRVRQIVNIISRTGGAMNVEHITRTLYKGLSENLMYPAMANTMQVLRALHHDGVVEALDSSERVVKADALGKSGQPESWRLLMPVDIALERVLGGYAKASAAKM